MMTAEVIVVLEDRIRAVGSALMMSTSAVSSAVADAVEACRRAEVSEYLAIVAQQIVAAQSDPQERAEAELREIIAVIKDEVRVQACDAGIVDSSRNTSDVMPIPRGWRERPLQKDSGYG